MSVKISELQATEYLPENNEFLMPVWQDSTGFYRSISFKQITETIEKLVKSGKRIKMTQREDQSIIFEELK